MAIIIIIIIITIIIIIIIIVKIKKIVFSGNRSSVRPKHAHYGPQPLQAPPPLDLHTEENDTYIYICA